jgi:hypothetical protein
MVTSVMFSMKFLSFNKNFASSKTVGYERASFQYYFNIYSSNIDVFDIFVVCNSH